MGGHAVSEPAVDWAEVREAAFDCDPLSDFSLSVEIPPLPSAVTRFIECSGDPEVDISELAAIVETDASLTIELLKSVNAARLASNRQISNVQRAITFIGIRSTNALLTSFASQRMLRAFNFHLLSPDWYACESLQRALFAREIAGALDVDTELAFSGALLQDFLLPVLTSCFSDEYREFLLSENGKRDLCDFERKTFGWDHAQAAAHIAHRWSLPDDLICCVFHHHHMRALMHHQGLAQSSALPVALSAFLPGQIDQTTDGTDRLMSLSTNQAIDLKTICAVVDEHLTELTPGDAFGFSLSEQFGRELNSLSSCEDEAT